VCSDGGRKASQPGPPGIDAAAATSPQHDQVIANRLPPQHQPQQQQQQPSNLDHRQQQQIYNDVATANKVHAICFLSSQTRREYVRSFTVLAASRCDNNSTDTARRCSRYFSERRGAKYCAEHVCLSVARPTV